MSANISCTPPELKEIAENALDDLLPPKSRGNYEKQYLKFQEWCKEKELHAISENVLIAYFQMQHFKYKPSTLWTIYSMLRSCLSIYKDIDISQYKKLQALLKRLSQGYEPKKSKIFEEIDINKFIQEADDKIYLAKKVKNTFFTFIVALYIFFYR